MACSLRSQKCNLPSSTYTLGSQHCLEKWNSTHTAESFPLLLGAFPLGPRQQQLWSVAFSSPYILNVLFPFQNSVVQKAIQGPYFVDQLVIKWKLSFALRLILCDSLDILAAWCLCYLWKMFCASHLLETRSVCGVQLQRTLPLTLLVVSTHPVRFWGTCAEGHQAMGNFCW